MLIRKPGKLSYGELKNLKKLPFKIPPFLQPKQEKDPAEPSYKPVRPGGGSPRLVPIVILLILMLIIFGVINFIKNSEPVTIAEAFIRQNAEIKTAIGDVMECDLWFPFKVTSSGNDPLFHLTFRVTGTRGETKVYVSLLYKQEQWRLVAASFDVQGKPRVLIGPSSEKRSDLPRLPDQGKESASLKSGHQYFRQNDLDKALVEYGKAVAADPQDDRAYYWRGRVHARKNLDDLAMADFRKTVELNPKQAEAYSWLGWLSSKSSRYDEAIAYITKSIELQPNNGWAYYNRGRCFFKKGDRPKALSDAEKSCSLGYAKGCQAYQELKKGLS